MCPKCLTFEGNVISSWGCFSISWVISSISFVFLSISLFWRFWASFSLSSFVYKGERGERGFQQLGAAIHQL